MGSGRRTRPPLPWMSLLGICPIRTPPSTWRLSMLLLKYLQTGYEIGRPLHDSIDWTIVYFLL